MDCTWSDGTGEVTMQGKTNRNETGNYKRINGAEERRSRRGGDEEEDEDELSTWSGWCSGSCSLVWG